jgi:DNA-binding XRE family transcriptional regulator
MTDAPLEFIQWFTDELDTRNLGMRDAAKLIGVSHPTITEIVTYHKQPSFDTCLKIAKAFDENPVVVLRRAALLPPAPAGDDLIEQALYDLGGIPIIDKEDILEYIKMRKQIAERRRKYGN